MEFTIDRSKWLCGRLRHKIEGGNGDSMMYAKSLNRSCCLGILADSCGVSKKELSATGVPSELEQRGTLPKVMNFLTEEKSDGYKRQSDYVRVNDNDELHQKDRERQLTKLFAKDGIKVKFVGRFL